MTAMSSSNGGDPAGVAGGREPVVDGGANLPALDRRLARPGMAGNQKNDTVAALDRLVETSVDRGPGLVEGMAMKVDDPIRLHRPAFQAPIPTGVESGPRAWSSRRDNWPPGRRQGAGDQFTWFQSRFFFKNFRLIFEIT